MTSPTPTTPVGQPEAREADPQVAALVEAMEQILDDMDKGGYCVCGLAKAQARIAYEPFNAEPQEWEPSYTYEEAIQLIIESEEAYGKRSLMRDVPKPQRRTALAAPDPAGRIAELEAEVGRWKRLYDDALGRRLEPPGCPTPGACSCPGGEAELAKRLGEALRRVAALEKGLKPFARAGELFELKRDPDTWDMAVYTPAAGDQYQIVGDDLRRARALLAQQPASVEGQ